MAWADRRRGFRAGEGELSFAWGGGLCDDGRVSLLICLALFRPSLYCVTDGALMPETRRVHLVAAKGGYDDVTEVLLL